MEELWDRLRARFSQALDSIHLRRRPAEVDVTAAPVDVAAPVEVVAPPTDQTGSAAPAASSTPEELPRRRGLIPHWAIWTAAGVLVLLVVVVLVIALWPSGAAVRVPDLAGLDRAAAVERAQVLGLRLRVRDTKFSDVVPAGGVVAQSPKAGSVVREGAVVTVDLSAGSETFAMPDVIGVRLEAARQTLRDAGLDVTFVTVASDAAEGTVISASPSAGTSVTVGETVRLSVAAGVGTTGTVVPSDLSGLTFVLDPAFPPASLTADINFDVARRVRALLEAAHARVVLTRSVTDTPDTATEADRLRRAKETTSTAFVQLYVVTSGTIGLQVQSLPGTGTPSAVYKSSKTLATAITTAFRADFPSTTTTTAVSAPMLKDYGGTAARIRLGSSGSNADKLNFSDAIWADSVARAIYSAIARTYGAD